jgi:hypothetical protein
MAELLTREHFAPYVDQVFRVRGLSQALTLTRVEHRQREDWEIGIGDRDPFNLIFRGGPENLLCEGLYTLDVEEGPTFELYVIPIHTPARDRQNYQAAFN